MKKQILMVIALLLVYGTLFGQTFTRITTGDIASGSRTLANAWGDYDNDGYVDLFANSVTGNILLYNNNGDGTFTKIVTGLLVTDGNGIGITWGDYDNDGYLDLFSAAGAGGDSTAKLFHNSGDRTFTKITFAHTSDFQGSSWGDYDNDGDLDLYVTAGGNSGAGESNFLYANNGDGTFTRITSGAIVSDVGTSTAANWADFDNDGDLDLFVANADPNDRNALYENNRDGTFTKIITGDLVNDLATSLGGSWGDYDNDGDLDLFVSNIGEVNFLYQNDGPPDYTFTKITTGDIVNDESLSIGSAWGDFDNDGDLDLFVANVGENNSLYSNNGDGNFTKITIGVIVNDGGSSFGASWADYDNDGDLDIFVSNVGGENFLYANNGNMNSWINIKCVGTVSNISAIGAKVRVKANINGSPVWQLTEISGQTGCLGQNSLNAEFGVGVATVVDSIRIEWPSGIIDRFADVQVNNFYTATEGQGIITSIKDKTLRMPEKFELSQNYPNPFNPSTTIEYQVDESSHIKLIVYNLVGQMVAILLDKQQQPGFYSVQWNGIDESGKQIASGVYLYQLQTKNSMQVRKLTLLR
jgi:enediyne biosynthesis protein E4